MKVFVTGSTGFLGRHIVKCLVENDYAVIAGIRDERKGADLKKWGVKTRRCFLENVKTLREAMEGADIVVHSAAVVSQGGQWKKFYSVNVEGTKNVLEAMRKNGIKRIIHISTVGVYGLGVHLKEGEIQEISPPLAPSFFDAPYSYTKALAEKVVVESDVEWVIIRPGIIYGEWDRFFIPSILKVMKKGIAPVFGRGDNILHLVYGGNVANMCNLAIKRAVKMEVFHAVDSYQVSYREFVRKLADEMGYSVREIRIPFFLAKLGAVFMEYPSYFLGYEPPFSRLALYPLCNRVLFSCRKAEKVLGWKSEVGFEEGILRTVRWLKNEGF